MVNDAWQEILEKVPLGIERHQRYVVYSNARNVLNLPHDEAMSIALNCITLPDIIFEVNPKKVEVPKIKRNVK